MIKELDDYLRGLDKVLDNIEDHLLARTLSFTDERVCLQWDRLLTLRGEKVAPGEHVSVHFNHTRSGHGIR
jgi:hypothetical protein